MRCTFLRHNAISHYEPDTRHSGLFAIGSDDESTDSGRVVGMTVSQSLAALSTSSLIAR